jgi:Flp pilus assembly protein TadD
VESFRRALEKDPDFRQGRMSWGYLLEQEGDFAGAREHYRVATSQHPHEGGAWLRLGVTELALGDAAAASAAFGRARALLGATAEVLAWLGEAEAARGAARAALQHFAAAERAQPGAERALHGRAFVLATTRDSGLRDAAGALSTLEACRARDGAGWSHRRVLAAALAAAGRLDEAVRAATEAWAVAPPPESARIQAERARYQAGQALER